MNPFKKAVPRIVVFAWAMIASAVPSEAITARNFDCFEFGVVTVGRTITAPALKLYNVEVKETLNAAANWAGEGKDIKFENGHLFGGPVFTYKGKSVACKYI